MRVHRFETARLRQRPARRLGRHRFVRMAAALMTAAPKIRIGILQPGEVGSARSRAEIAEQRISMRLARVAH